MAAPTYTFDEYIAPEKYQFESELETPLNKLILDMMGGELSPEEQSVLSRDIENLQRGEATRAARVGGLPTGAVQAGIRDIGMQLPLQVRLMEQQKQQQAMLNAMAQMQFQGQQQQYGHGQQQQAGQFGYGQKQQAEQFGFDKMWGDYWQKKQMQLEREMRQPKKTSPWKNVLGLLGTGVGLATGSAIPGLVGSLFKSPQSSTGGGYKNFLSNYDMNNYPGMQLYGPRVSQPSVNWNNNKLSY